MSIPSLARGGSKITRGGSRRIHLDDHPNDKGVQLMWWLAHRKKYIHENNRWPPSLTKISKYFAAQKKTRKTDGPVSPIDDNGDPIITIVDDIGKADPGATEDYPDGYPDHEPGHIHKNGSYNPIKPSNSHFDLSDMKSRSLLPFNEQKGFLHLNGEWHPNADFTLADFMFIRSMSWKALKLAFPALGRAEMAAMEELRQDLLRSGTRVGLEMQTWLRNNMGSIATEISRDGVAYISETRLLTVQSIDEIADIAEEIQNWNRMVQSGAIQASTADIEHATRLFQMCQRRREQTIAAIQEHELSNVGGMDHPGTTGIQEASEKMRGVPVGGEHGMQTEEGLIFERRNIVDQGQRDRSMAAAESQRDEALASMREARDAEIAAANSSVELPSSASVGADVDQVALNARRRAAIIERWDNDLSRHVASHNKIANEHYESNWKDRRFGNAYDIEDAFDTSPEAYAEREFANSAAISEMNDEQLGRAYQSFFEEANWKVQDSATGKWVPKQDVGANKALVGRQMNAPSMDPNIPSNMEGGRV